MLERTNDMKIVMERCYRECQALLDRSAKDVARARDIICAMLDGLRNDQEKEDEQRTGTDKSQDV